jgi:DNA-binding MarR family transcriptional regulator
MPPDAPPPAGGPGRFAFDGLDRVLHEKARLGILTSLLAHRDGLVFNQLRDLCALTDGNLSRHLTTLQEAGLIEIWKGVKGKRPQTLVRLTPDGRERFLGYLSLLESIVNGALTGAEAGPANENPAKRAGWAPA